MSLFVNTFRRIFKCLNKNTAQSRSNESEARSNELIDDEDEYFRNTRSQDFTEFIKELLEKDKSLENSASLAPGESIENDFDSEEEEEEKEVLEPKFDPSLIKFDVENSKDKSGGSANVRQAYLSLNSQLIPIAVKTYKFDLEKCDKTMDNFKNEVCILKILKHENVLRYIGVIDEPNPSILTEWCSGPNLYEFMNSRYEECYELSSLFELMDIALQISNGVEYLHYNEIIHRDLKSQNIFLIQKELVNGHREWSVKVGDFGLALSPFGYKYNLKIAQSKTAGSIYWMPPEVINVNLVEDPYTKMSDVYSFGIILYEIVTGELPFKNKETFALMRMIGNKKIKIEEIPCGEDTPQDCLDLLRECIDYERENRPIFMEITERLREIRDECSKTPGRFYNK